MSSKDLVLMIDGKITGFPHPPFRLENGQNVIVETNRGIEWGTLSIICCATSPNKRRKGEMTCKRILRTATPEDQATYLETVRLKHDYLQKAKELLLTLNLPIKLLKAELLFDKSHFYVDYTYLIDANNPQKRKPPAQPFSSALAKAIQCKVLITEYSDRNIAKLLGAVGICGHEVCCKKFLTKLPIVSVKLAKEQGLPINMTKLSGQCGRLKCCLRYEKENYENGKFIREKSSKATEFDAKEL